MSAESNTTDLDGDDVILVVNDKLNEIVEIDSDSESSNVSSDSEEDTEINATTNTSNIVTEAAEVRPTTGVTITESIIIPAELSRLIPAPDVSMNTEAPAIILPPSDFNIISPDDFIIESISEIQVTPAEVTNEKIDMETECQVTNTIPNITSLGLLASYGSDSESDFEAEDITPARVDTEKIVTKEAAITKLNQFIEEGTYRIISDSSDESDEE